MQRKEFIKQCTGCLGLMVAPALLQSCSGTKYLNAAIEDSDMIVPIDAFADKGNGSFRSYVVLENEILQFPICVYRISADDYKALWMQCTHQGNELQVFGDMLQCPAHGSEFTRTGAVQNGPAYMSLRTFPVTVANDRLKISLK
ncbi:Rieske (2Fe-2S) protein [Chryseolinea sp. T2]|uniref:Rieske (2Fe-2S) protein n=1 Tax=Chryseolinea sp. T2 TaxID=3129255 RepID=UPI00307719F5